MDASAPDMACACKGVLRRPGGGLMVLLLLLLGGWGVGVGGLEYRVEEERTPGVLANVASDSGLRETAGSEFTNLRYSLLTQGNTHAQYFRLDNVTSDLYIHSRLDREALCSYIAVCNLTLEVVAKASLGSFFKKLDVFVLVQDINDNAPAFPSPTHTIRIRENAAVLNNFTLPEAQDRDMEGPNSALTYRLASPSPTFRLLGPAPGPGHGSLYLQLTEPLDRETTPSYSLVLVAEDGGLPRRSGQVEVTVQVEDVNDNTPVFAQPLYAVNASETAAVNVTLLTLVATDADEGNNGRLSYVFAARQPEHVLSLFHLDAASGQLRVRRSLEYESGTTFTLLVEARDNGVPQLTARTSVQILVEDTENNPPTIEVDTFSADGVARTSEFSSLGSAVAHIRVLDPDTGANGIVTCTESRDAFALQRLNVDEYKAIVVDPLNREEKAAHNVSLTCHDAGSPPLGTSAWFTVLVLDENDNAPRFEQDVYEVTVAEGNVTPLYVTSLTATDADVGVNAEITYALMPGLGSSLFVLQNNGTLVAVRTLDREAFPRVTLTVMAIDHGKKPLNGTATVIVYVSDVNDNAPMFNTSLMVLSVYEEAPNGTSVAHLQASDADVGSNANVTYRIAQEDAGVPFVLLPDGRLRTNASLDREWRDVYEFVVVGTDGGTPALSGSCTVRVRVLDINDQDPVFLFPTDGNNTVSIPYTLEKGEVVTTLVAQDDDVGPNGNVMYHVIGGTGSTLFEVDAVSGDLVLSEPLTERDVGTLSLLVVAQDQGSPQRTNRQNLLVTVFYSNTSTPGATPDDQESTQVVEASSQNMIIVAVLVACTALLAVGVVVVICLVRRLDSQRRNYRAKSVEEKFDSRLQNWQRENAVAQSVPASLPSQSTSSEEEFMHKKKEVSFSLDEDNNVSLNSTFENQLPLSTQHSHLPVSQRGDPPLSSRSDRSSSTSSSQTPDSGRGSARHPPVYTLPHLHPHPEETEYLEMRVPDDGASDGSGDMSTGDSGRGGSDVDIQSQNMALHAHDNGVGRLDTSMDPAGGRGSHRCHNPPRPARPGDYPLTSFSRPSSVRSQDYGGPGRSQAPPSSQYLPHPQDQRGDFVPRKPLHPNSLPHSHPQSHSLSRVHPQNHSNPHPLRTRAAEEPVGNYVQLKGAGDYVDMSGAGRGPVGVAPVGGVSHNPAYRGSRPAPPDALSDGGATGTWDDNTTTSGSYTVDPVELCSEIDRLFFQESKDVVV